MLSIIACRKTPQRFYMCGEIFISKSLADNRSVTNLRHGLLCIVCCCDMTRIRLFCMYCYYFKLQTLNIVLNKIYVACVRARASLVNKYLSSFVCACHVQRNTCYENCRAVGTEFAILSRAKG